MSERKKGVILSYVYTISQILVNFLYIKLLLSVIGQSEYGLYQIVASLIAYLKIMQSGLSVGVSRFYCVYRANKDRINMENTLAISKRIFYILSIFTVILGTILIFVTKEFYKSSFTPMELYETQIMLFILIINMIIDVNNIVYVVSITAEEKFTFLKVIDLLSILIQPIVVLVILYRIPYASVIVVIQLFINIVFSYARKRYALKKLHTVIRYHNYDKDLIMSLSKFSVITILALIADQIFWKADQLILGKMFGTAIVGIYSVGSQVFTNYMHFSTSITNVFLPKISKLYGNGTNMRPLSELFVKIGRIQFLILGLVLIVFVLFGNEFIGLWVGPGYTDAYLVAVIVMLAFTIDLIQNIGLTILQVANKFGFRAKMYFIIAVLNVVSTIVLAKRYGSVGAAISTSVSMVIGSGFIMNYYYSKIIHLDIKRFWKEIFNIFIFDIPILVLGYLISFITMSNGWLQFIIHCMLTVVVYCVINYLFAMNEYEKTTIKKTLNKFLIKN